MVVETEEDKWIYKVRNVNRLSRNCEIVPYLTISIHASQRASNKIWTRPVDEISRKHACDRFFLFYYSLIFNPLRVTVGQIPVLAGRRRSWVNLPSSPRLWRELGRDLGGVPFIFANKIEVEGRSKSGRCVVQLF